MIELIVVVIIIAVLAAVAGVATNRYVAHTRETAAAATLKELWKGAQAKAASDDQEQLTLPILQQVASDLSGGGLALGPVTSSTSAPLAAGSRVTVLDSTDPAAAEPTDGTRVVWAYADTTGALSGSAGALGLGTTAGGGNCAFLYATNLSATKSVIGKADATLGCRGQVAIARATGTDTSAPAGGGTPTPTTDPTPTPDPTPTGPQPITVAVTDTFNGTGVLGAAETGGRTWIENTAGTIVRSSGKATSNAVPGTNPMALIEAGTPDVDVTLAASKGGEAIYARASDAANWVRARLRAYDKQVTSEYYVTQYWHASYATEYQYSQTVQTAPASAGSWVWSGQTNTCVSSPGTNTDTESGNSYGFTTSKTVVGYSPAGGGGCAQGKYWRMTNSATRSITPPQYSTSYTWSSGNPGSGWSSTGSSRTVESGGYWSTAYCSSCATYQDGPYTSTSTEKRYELVVEKSVAGTVTALKTVDLGTTAPTSIRLVAKGDQLKVYSGTTLQATLTEAFNSTVTRHGFGLGGPTGYLTTGLDEVSIAPAP